MRNSALLAMAIGLLAFTLGFAYGNFFDSTFSFHVRDWQTLGSTLVAIIAAAVGYFAVWNTQRISVMTKEQDRIQALLPGLRQVNELLIVIRGPLNSLRPQHRYQATLLLDSAIHMLPTDSVENAIRRQLTLADEHLHREVAEIIFDLKIQARIVTLGNDEVRQCQAEVANIHKFAAASHEGLREMVKRVEASYERENEKLTRALKAFDTFSDSIKQRISRAERRQNTIRHVVDKFFETD